MKKYLLALLIAPTLCATARNSYFSLGVAAPIHSSAPLEDRHKDVKTRFAPTITVGTHLNRWIGLEAESFYMNAKISGPDTYDRAGLRSCGVLANVVARSDFKRIRLFAAIGLGMTRNRTTSYEIGAGTPVRLAVALKGTARNRLAGQIKIGALYECGPRLSIGASLAHVYVGNFAYLDDFATPYESIKFKARLTSINTFIQFRF